MLMDILLRENVLLYVPLLCISIRIITQSKDLAVTLNILLLYFLHIKFIFWSYNY